MPNPSFIPISSQLRTRNGRQHGIRFFHDSVRRCLSRRCLRVYSVCRLTLTHLGEEVEHPPDGDLYGVWTHPETPRMDRLRDEYIQRTPQVWQTTTTAPGSVRPKTDYEALFYVMPCEKDSRFFFDSYNDRGH